MFPLQARYLISLSMLGCAKQVQFLRDEKHPAIKLQYSFPITKRIKPQRSLEIFRPPSERCHQYSNDTKHDSHLNISGESPQRCSFSSVEICVLWIAGAEGVFILQWTAVLGNRKIFAVERMETSSWKKGFLAFWILASRRACQSGIIDKWMKHLYLQDLLICLRVHRVVL